MRRAAVLVALASAVLPLLGAPPSPAETGWCQGSPLDPTVRASRFVAQPAGTESKYCIFFGPYVIPGGQDLSRVDFDLALAEGFIVAGAPSAVYADGLSPLNQEMHIHHSHWWFIDPNDRDSDPLPWMRWLSGSGEERTRGDFRTVGAADPSGPMYGIHIAPTDRVGMINMLHNKTPTAKVVWIKVDLVFVHGSAAAIKDAPGPYQGRDFHNVTGVLHGNGFNVPRSGGRFVYPYDLPPGPPVGGVSPGVGYVWTAPFDGTIVIGAGHLHPGGERVVVTNLGSEASPCASTRSDGIPGTMLYELNVIDRVAGARFTEDFQIEITKPGFRAKVRVGDRIALNGIYDATDHAWWDAMSFTGFYIDELDKPAPGEGCSVVDVGGGDPTQGIPNRPWEGVPDQLCGVPGYSPCGYPEEQPLLPGVATDRVVIGGFSFLPGDLGHPTGPAQVRRGTQLEIVNADMAQYVRHTVTSCEAPCNGTYVANYPLPDGTFDSGYLGWEPTTGGKQVPTWTLDTAPLTPGVFTYFCRVHPWMRGAIQIV
jgi:plastocyanin